MTKTLVFGAAVVLVGSVLVEAEPARPGALAGQAAVRVVLETAKGPIEVEVDLARAPISAGNFLRYVDGGLYDGGVFHRAVRPDTETRDDVHIEVIQGGRARGRGRGEGRAGFEPIVLERTSATGLRHLDGTISMARSTPDSATSDFFICVGDQPELDFGGKRNADGQGFAAFGRVVAGMNVVKAIHAAPVRPGTESLDPQVGLIRASRKPWPRPLD